MIAMGINDAECPYHLNEMLPMECRDDCTAMGDNYAACEAWVDMLGLNVPRDICINALKEMGAWEDCEIEDMTKEELNVTFLWIAAGIDQ